MAITLEAIRQDEANITEGLTFTDILLKGLSANTYLQSGLTFTPKILNNAGTIYIPKVTIGEGNEAIDLCAAPTTANISTIAYTPIQISKKIYTQFHSCFGAYHIADLNVLRAMEIGQWEILNKSYANSFDKVFKTALPTMEEVEVDYENIGLAVGQLKRAFKNKTGVEATFLFVNDAFLDKLDLSLSKVGSDLSFQALVNGYQGQFRGLQLISMDALNDVTTPMAIACNLNSIFRISLGTYEQYAGVNANYEGGTVGFNNGFVVDVLRDGSGVPKTNVMYPIEWYINKDFILKGVQKPGA